MAVDQHGGGGGGGTPTTNTKTALTNFKSAIDDFFIRLTNKLTRLEIKKKYFNSTNLTLEDNTIHEYNGSGIKTLTVKYPKEEFISTILLSTSKTGPITIKFPDGSTYAGGTKLDFYPAENWEINIHNGRISAMQLYEED